MRPSPDEIDAATSAWHVSDSHLSLFEWLGWSWKEYQAWVKDWQDVPDRPLPSHEEGEGQ